VGTGVSELVGWEVWLGIAVGVVARVTRIVSCAFCFASLVAAEVPQPATQKSQANEINIRQSMF
jgi:hypothetical protein